MTLAGMREFGAEAWRDGYGRFRVRAGKGYLGRVYDVEPDASNASYFLAAAALTGGRVRVRHLNLASAQGDVRFVDVLERMGCRVEAGQDFIEVRGPERLRGVDADMNAMPDLAQTLAAIAPFADGPTTIRNVASMRIKETDRISAVVTELRKLGVQAVELPDGMVIPPSERILPARIDTYDDHRMAMSFSLVGLKAKGIVIQDSGCVAKSFPGYFQKLDELR
jgi:3-phosphoshikimate 1-carboxyvinyltransferase